ncbi:MAG: calycin-like domain-containing protein [Prevotellaceae bacterium]|nr:calycin-like domain-containing protein [Prevotellaceae bacterium]
MKKIVLLLTLLISVLSLNAKDYTDDMTVSLGTSSLGTQQATVSINQESDGTYTMQLNNLVFASFPVGNITYKGVSGTTSSDGITTYTGNGTATVSAGTDPTYEGKWLGGSTITSADVNISEAESKGDNLYLNMTVKVSVGLIPLNVTLVFGSKDKITTAIRPVVSPTTSTPTVYSINGKRVNTVAPGHIYLFRQSDGSVKKIVK